MAGVFAREPGHAASGQAAADMTRRFREVLVLTADQTVYVLDLAAKTARSDK